MVEKLQKTGDLPNKGKGAVTGIPSRSDLPKPVIKLRDNAALILDRYIKLLEKKGYPSEAATIGTVYNAMVEANYLAVPDETLLTRD